MVIAHQGKKITNGKKTNGILRESLQTFPDKIKWKTQGPRLTGLGATNLTRKEVKLILKPSVVMERSHRWFYKTAPTTTGAAWSARSHETFAKCNSWKKSHRCAAQLSHSGYQLGAIRALNLIRRIDSSLTT